MIEAQGASPHFDAEPITAALTPAQAFAEHVAQVKQQGDAIDATRLFKLGSRIEHYSAAAASLELLPVDASVASRFAAVGTIAAVTAGRAAFRARKGWQAGTEALETDTQEITGHRYELFQRKSATTLMWYGPYPHGQENEAPTFEHMQEIVRLARDNDIEWIATPRSLANYIDEGIAGKTHAWSAADLLGIKRFIYSATDLLSKDELVMTTTEQWSEIAGLDKRPDIGNLIGKLKGAALDGRHTLVYAYENGSKADLAKLQTIARDTLERRLTDVDTQLSPLTDPEFMQKAAEQTGLDKKQAESLVPKKAEKPADNQRGAAPGRPAKKQSTSVGGQIIDGMVYWPNNVAEPLNKAFSMDDAERLALTNNNGQGSRVTLALELTIFEQLASADKQQVHSAGKTLPQEGSGSVQEPRPAYEASSRMYQADIMQPRKEGMSRLESIRERQRLTACHRGLLAVPAGAVAFLVWTSGFGIENLSNGLYDDALAVTRQNMALHNNIDPRTANFRDADVKNQLDRSNLSAAGWHDFRAVQNQLASWLGGDASSGSADPNGAAAQLQPGAGSSPPYHSVANTPTGNEPGATKNQADWYITPHGINPAGFWPYGTADELIAQKGNAAHDASLQWTVNESVDGGLQIADSAPPGTQKWLEVGKEINRDDVTHTDAQPGVHIRVPTLYGTTIIAATLRQPDGSQVPMQALLRGVAVTLDVLAPVDPTGDQLTYWLAKPDDAHNIVPYMNPGFKNGLTIDGDMAPTRLSDIHRQWQAAIPNLPSNSTAQVQAVHDYIQQHWDYSLEPLPKEFGSIQNLSEFNSLEIQAAKAKCDTANTIGALLDPQNTEVFGYLNGGATDILSARELHQETMTPDGGLIDFTPPDRSGAAKDYFSEQGLDSPAQPGSTMSEIILGTEIAAGAIGTTGLMLMALAGYKKRQAIRNNIRQKLHSVERGLGRSMLAVMPGVHFASEALDWALYSQGSNAAGIRARAARNTMPAAEVAERLITRADLHSADSVKRIDALLVHALTADEVDFAAVKALKAAKRIMRFTNMAVALRPTPKQVLIEELPEN